MSLTLEGLDGWLAEKEDKALPLLHNVKRLCLVNLDFEAFNKILALCPNITELNINKCEYTQFADKVPLSQVCFPYLNTMSITSSTITLNQVVWIFNNSHALNTVNTIATRIVKPGAKSNTVTNVLCQDPFAVLTEPLKVLPRVSPLPDSFQNNNTALITWYLAAHLPQTEELTLDKDQGGIELITPDLIKKYPGDFSRIKLFHSTGLSVSSLLLLLKKMPALQRLTIKDCDWNDWSQEQLKALPGFVNLIAFEMQNCKNVPPEYIKTMAVKAPNVYIFKLVDCDGMAEFDDCQVLNGWRSLSILSIEKSDLAGNALSTLISQNYNLTQLHIEPTDGTLKGFDYLQFNGVVQQNSLSKLCKLNNIKNINAVLSIMSLCKDATKLTIHDVNVNGIDPLFCERIKNHLGHIHTLSIRKCTMSLYRLAHLLNCLPKINELQIVDCNVTPFMGAIPQFTLQYLKEVYVCELKNQDSYDCLFSCIVPAARQSLHRIEIGTEHELPIPDEVPLLPRMEHLTIDAAHVKHKRDRFMTMLKSMPNLNYLRCNFPFEKESLFTNCPELELPRCKILHVYAHDNSIPILDAAPNVESLLLNNYFTTKGFKKLPKNQFYLLETVNIHHTYNAKCLAPILKISQHAKTFRLHKIKLNKEYEPNHFVQYGIMLHLAKEFDLKSGEGHPSVVNALQAILPNMQLNVNFGNFGGLDWHDSSSPSVDLDNDSSDDESEKEYSHHQDNSDKDDSSVSKRKRKQIKQIWSKKGTGNDPNPIHYRENVYDGIKLNDGPDGGKKPFVLKAVVPGHFSVVNVVYHHDDLWESTPSYTTKNNIDFYYARCGLYFTKDKTRLPLLSYTPHERVTHWNAQGAQSNELKFYYCSDDNRYYAEYLGIFNYSMKYVDLNYRFQTKPYFVPISSNPFYKRYNDIRNYAPRDLRGNYETAIQAMSAMEERRVGRCEQRASIFQIEYPNESRQITSAHHAYIEVKGTKGRKNIPFWITADLGGSECDLEVDDSLHPNIRLEQRKRLQKLYEEHRQKMISFEQQCIQKDNDEQANGSECNHKISPQESPSPAVETLPVDVLARFPTFRTWEIKKQESDISSIVANVLTGSESKYLFTVKTKQDATMLKTMMLSLCYQNKQTYFCIDSIKDSICSAPWLKLSKLSQTKEPGQLTRGPGGPLYRYLQVKGAKTLLVNLSEFSAREMVSINTLWDPVPSIDGQSLPSDTIVITVNTQNGYQGEDLYGRFTPEQKILIDTDLQELQKNNVNSSDSSFQQINCFGSKMWKQRVIGHWVMEGDRFYFKPGLLWPALKSNKNIHFLNPPIDPAFDNLCTQLKHGGKYDVFGQQLQLPPLQVHKSNGPYFDRWHEVIDFSADNLNSVDFVLNPGLFMQSLHSYVQSDTFLYATDGPILRASKVQVAYLSRNLNDAQWGELIEFLHTHNKQLKILVPHGIELTQFPERKPVSIRPNYSLNTNSIVISDDIDFSVEQYKSNYGADLRLDISEIKSDELLVKINYQFDEKTLSFLFSSQKGVLWQALMAGQHVILYGHFTHSLVDALMPVLFQRLSFNNQHQTYSGSLTLVTNNNAFLRGAPIHSVEMVDLVGQKIQALMRYHGATIRKLMCPEALLSMPYIKAKTYLRFIGSGIDEQQVQSLWNHLEHVSINLDTQLNIGFENTLLFNSNRRKIFRNGLERAPCLFISGITGAGKSTFMQELNTLEYKVYYEEKDLVEWALARDKDKWLILFYDESNTEGNHLTRFKTLYQDNPFIVIAGKFYPLTDKHRLVCAGNPSSYGAQRTCPRLFAELGNAIVFDPLPPSVLYKQLLQPLLEGIDDASREQICEIILKTYLLVAKSYTTDQVLISPRELKHMVLITLAYQSEGHTAINSACYAAFQVACSVLSKSNRSFFKEDFNQLFDLKIDTILFLLHPEIQSTIQLPGFIASQSRMNAWLHMQDLIKVRDLKRRSSNEAIKQCEAIGGLSIEGEPGEGKSAFVLAILAHFGVADPQDCLVPASMPLKQKLEKLDSLFHNGDYIVGDELNCAIGLEKSLNAMLMGRDRFKQRAKVHGTVFFFTQNPSYFPGRLQVSNALKRRVINIEFEPYNEEECILILQLTYQLPYLYAKELTKRYLDARDTAEQHGYQPKPSFRDLIIEGRRWGQELQSQAQVLNQFERIKLSDTSPLVTPDNANNKLCIQS